MEKDLKKLVKQIIKIERRYPNPLKRKEVIEILSNCQIIDDKLVFDFSNYIYEEDGNCLLNREEAFKDVKKYIRVLDDLVGDNDNRALEATYVDPKDILVDLKMDSDVAMKWYMEFLQKNFVSAAYSASFLLAKERGCYKEYDIKKDMKNPFIELLLKKYLDPSDETKDCGVFEQEDIGNYAQNGRRNESLTIMPNVGKRLVYYESIEKWVG